MIIDPIWAILIALVSAYAGVLVGEKIQRDRNNAEQEYNKWKIEQEIAELKRELILMKRNLK